METQDSETPFEIRDGDDFFEFREGADAFEYREGTEGPPGPPGPAGASTATYRHVQNVPDVSWTVTHNLGYRPAVGIEDSAGSIVYGNIEHVDENSLVVTFAAAFSGYVNCS